LASQAVAASDQAELVLTSESTRERRKGDREDRATPIPLVNELALVLSDDSVGHEQAESGPTFFGGEVGLEKVMPVVV
jgi:hypothetical protein